MNFFIISGQQQQGPYTVDELRNRHITQDTLVWAEGMEQWLPAWQVDALRPLFRPQTDSGTGTSSPTPPPMGTTSSAPYTSATASSQAAEPAQATQEPQSDEPQDFASSARTAPSAPHKRHGHRGCATLLVVALALFIALVSTCPTPEAHRDKVSGEVNQMVGELTGGATDAWGLMGSMITSHIVGIAIDQILTVDNYMVCSVGRIHYLGKTRTVSLGVLGHVFTFATTDVQKALEQDKGDASDHFSSPAEEDDDEQQGEDM